MDDTLRLALVNHAILHGTDYDAAWALVDETATRVGGQDVRKLADAVRETAFRGAWGKALP